jgi:Glycosyl transferases group 1
VKARIAVDATSISSSGKGISRVQLGTLRALAAFERHELVAYVSEDVDVELPTVRVRRRPALWWEQFGLPRAARDADAVLTWTDRLPLVGEGRFVVWLFELPIHRIALNRERGAGAYQRASDFITHLLWDRSRQRAARVLAASAATAAELGGATVLHPGIDGRFTPGAGRDGRYLFHLSSSDPRDNTATIIKAVRIANDRLREPVELVVPAGRISDDELLELYRGAAGYLDASLFEGFGYQPLEAMACGAPVVASTASREVVGAAGLLCDPLDVQAQADAIVRLLEEPGLADELRRLGLERAHEFTWERTAAQLADVLDEVAS